MEAAVIDKVVKEADKADGKLILAEEIAEGRVTWRSMMLFLKGLGGDKPIFFMTAWMAGIALMHGGSMLGVWFLGYWGSQYETHKPEEVHVNLYVLFHKFFHPFQLTFLVYSFLSLYSAILVASVLIYLFATLIYNLGTQRASRTINAQLVDSVLGSTLRLVTSMDGFDHYYMLIVL